jgi:TolA-binding protein
MRIFPKVILILTVLIQLVGVELVHAKPEPLSVLVSQLITTKKSKEAPVTMTDYRQYWRAGAVLKALKPTLAEVESVERALLQTKMESVHRSLDSSIENRFYALEIKRGEIYAMTNKTAAALASFQRGLQGLSTKMWPMYWPESASKALAKICVSGGIKKIKNESCLNLAKRISGVFPKLALETRTLRELPESEVDAVLDVPTDRLNAGYSEKIEKDELAFAVILDFYLKGQYSDLEDEVAKFQKEFPKSSIRFRADFLLAEGYTRRSKVEQAKEIYLRIIDQVPLTFYAVVSAERLKVQLKDRIVKQPIFIDRDLFNFNFLEKQTVRRIEELVRQKKTEEVGIEIESLNRLRSYSTDSILYLVGLSSHVGNHLGVFRLITELIQRQYSGLMQSDLIDLIFPMAFESEVKGAALETKLDPLVIQSLTKQESGFRANALSSSGALGLMQLMPFTAIEVQKDVELRRMFEAPLNLSIGSQYLARLMERFEGNLAYSLAGYNAGPHRVMKWRKEIVTVGHDPLIEFIESIPFKETREYVAAILRNKYWYQVRRGQIPQSVNEAWKNPKPDTSATTLNVSASPSQSP